MAADFRLCQRCGRELCPGSGDFFEVRVEAVADPSPPILDGQSCGDAAGELERLARDLDSLSLQEAMDQVYRRFTFDLCGECYRIWIENPAGG